MASSKKQQQAGVNRVEAGLKAALGAPVAAPVAMTAAQKRKAAFNAAVEKMKAQARRQAGK